MLKAYWLDFGGARDPRGPQLGVGDEATMITYEGHRFLVTTSDGEEKEIGTIVAGAGPGRAVIEAVHLNAVHAAVPTHP